MKITRSCWIVLVVAIFMVAVFSKAALAASKEDLAEKIRLLEIQIQQLKELKGQKKLVEDKERQCVQVTGEEKLCSCLAEALPQELNFEQYVHSLVLTKEEMKYDAMKPEAQQVVDASIAARKKCVDRGFFK